MASVLSVANFAADVCYDRRPGLTPSERALPLRLLAELLGQFADRLDPPHRDTALEIAAEREVSAAIRRASS